MADPRWTYPQATNSALISPPINSTEDSSQPTDAAPNSWRIHTLRSSLRDWSQKKVSSVALVPETQEEISQDGARSMGPKDAPAQQPVSLPNDQTFVEILPRTSSAATSKKSIPEPKATRKSKPAPIPPIRERGVTVRNNFSYDALRERADVWKRERNKKPVRATIPEKDEQVAIDGNTDSAQIFPELNQGTPVEDNQRPKICFTKEESDKVDKDILKLMNALEHNHYPFNRDKQLLFAKLRSTRRKQMGLLFAHRELDNLNYFNTEREAFGYDVISNNLGIMYNVIDSISRDIYELRELLYYERKNQVPPRKGSSDRRNSENQTSSAVITSSVGVNRQNLRDQDEALRDSDKIVSPVNKTKSSRSPSRPILKRSVSSESFKSAKSEDSNDTIIDIP